MKRTIALLAISASLSALAQTAPAPTRTLTLADCLSLAAENNAAVLTAAGNAEAAKEVEREAFTNYFPKIDAFWVGMKTNKAVIQYDLPSIGELLPPGIETLIPPQLAPQIAPMLNTSIGSIDLIKKGWVGSIGAVQPLFMGGMIVNGNKLARTGREAADLQREKAADNVAVTTASYYWQIATLQSKKRTLEKVTQLVDTLAAHVGAAVKAGVITRNELLKVELKRNELLAAAVDLDNGIDLSRNLLAQYIGLNGENIGIDTEATPDTLPPLPMQLFMEPSEALPATADYRLLEKQVKAMELKKKMAVGENMPQIGVGAGWTCDDLINTQRHSFAAVSLMVNVPISGWWGGAHKIKQANIATRNARIEQENLSQMLEIAMENAWDNLTASHRKLEIAYRSIGQATENLRLNENYYRAGTTTITELLDAQTLYRRSLDSYSEAYGDFRLQQARYLNATGRASAIR